MDEDEYVPLSRQGQRQDSTSMEYEAVDYQPVSDMMYEPVYKSGPGCAINSLSELTHHYVEATPPSSVIIRGVTGYARFLNGPYRRVEDMQHDGRCVYRTEKPVPPDSGPASGQLLFMYYKEKQQSWAIGMRLGSSGVAAFRRNGGRDPVVGTGVWKISDENGKFTDEPAVTCEAAGGYTLPPKKQTAETPVRAAEVLPAGTSRGQAEAILTAKKATPGAYVIRQSTSAPNTFILSVLASKDVQHLRIEVVDGMFCVAGTDTKHKTLSALTRHFSKKTITLSSGESILLTQLVAR